MQAPWRQPGFPTEVHAGVWTEPGMRKGKVLEDLKHCCSLWGHWESTSPLVDSNKRGDIKIQHAPLPSLAPRCGVVSPSSRR